MLCVNLSKFNYSIFLLTLLHANHSCFEQIPYFIDQSPRRLIISFCRYLRRLFEGGDYSRAASIKEYCHTITFITSYKFVPSFIVILFLINVSIYVLFICLDPLSLNAAS